MSDKKWVVGHFQQLNISANVSTDSVLKVVGMKPLRGFNSSLKRYQKLTLLIRVKILSPGKILKRNNPFSVQVFILFVNHFC